MSETESKPSPFLDKPRFYANGFNVNNTLVDFQLYLYENGIAVGTVNLSPITAKNVAKSLLDLVDRYEKGLDTKVEDFNDMWERMEKLLKNNEGGS
jgi:hypothetical protein